MVKEANIGQLHRLQRAAIENHTTIIRSSHRIDHSKRKLLSSQPASSLLLLAPDAAICGQQAALAELKRRPLLLVAQEKEEETATKSQEESYSVLSSSRRDPCRPSKRNKPNERAREEDACRTGKEDCHFTEDLIAYCRPTERTDFVKRRRRRKRRKRRFPLLAYSSVFDLSPGNLSLSSPVLVVIVSLLLFLSVSDLNFITNGEISLIPGIGAVRLVRQSTQEANLELQHLIQQQQQQQQRQHQQQTKPSDKVPYTKFLVSRACEWKSNLFVPKTNDILFAQSSQLQQQDHHQPSSSSVTYETYYANSNNYINSRQQQASTSAYRPDASNSKGTVLLSTDSKALVLALPAVAPSQSFAGYEPACSIRLIVPRNMRILAKLTLGRLTFAQGEQIDSTNLDHSSGADLVGYDQFQQPFVGSSMQQKILWLNVSQNEFVETENRIIETEGNILAVRFLLDRFAYKQQPDLRFQLVLTAFQTLGENSDLSVQTRPGTSDLTTNGGAQFICDQQRLIAANLACDGFKNCQDGHDEEANTCALLNLNRGQQLGAEQFPLPPQIRNQISSNGSVNQQQQQSAGYITRVFNFITRDTSSVTGFLLGFMLILILLLCCSSSAYICLIIWRRFLFGTRLAQDNKQGPSYSSEYQRRKRNDLPSMSNEEESQALAASQNLENSARVQQLLPPARLQSILKRPGMRRPAEPPPEVPATNQRGQSGRSSSGSRGALSTSLSSGSRVASTSSASNSIEFKPTPAKRLTRPTRPVPRPEQQQQTTYSSILPSSIGGHQPSRATSGSTTGTDTTGIGQTKRAGGAVVTTVSSSMTTSSYSYSSIGTIRYSEHTSHYRPSGSPSSRQQQPPQIQQHPRGGRPLVTGPVAPSSVSDTNYPQQQGRDTGSVSPRASLI